MTDRRVGTFCLIHGIEFRLCKCEDRRTTTDVGLQVVVCVKCNRFFEACACDQPELEPRSAA